MLDAQTHDHLLPEETYQALDEGIRFAVRVLTAAGFDTCQSCQGGVGHAYSEPTVDLVAGYDDAKGFGALAALQAYGLKVSELALTWTISNGLPCDKLWRIRFSATMEARADEQPLFAYSYRANAVRTLKS